MAKTVKRTIWLPARLARDAETQARAQRKTFSAVVQEALREARSIRLKSELSRIQHYWSQEARRKRLFTQAELERYLG